MWGGVQLPRACSRRRARAATGARRCADVVEHPPRPAKKGNKKEELKEELEKELNKLVPTMVDVDGNGITVDKIIFGSRATRSRP